MLRGGAVVGIELVCLVRLLVTDSAVLAELLRIIFHNSKKYSPHQLHVPIAIQICTKGNTFRLSKGVCGAPPISRRFFKSKKMKAFPLR